jgi:hypothetical protein
MTFLTFICLNMELRTQPLIILIVIAGTENNARDVVKSVRSIRRDILESLSAEIDAFFKQVELKYWGLLPWDAISEKLAVQDFFRELSRGKKEAIIAYSDRYSPEEKLAASCLHDMACSELTFWAKSISRRLYSHPWVVEFSSRLQTLVFEHIIKTLTCSSTFAVNIRLKRTAKERNF